jgi:hypothetical protein
MTIAITTALNDARLTGTLTFLDSGAGNAAIQIYGGNRPATPDDAPTDPLLSEIPLNKPAGSVSAGNLLLASTTAGLILTTGIATWARVLSGNGDVAFDCDAGQGAGAWEVQLAQANLLAGGEAKLVSAILG